MVLELFDWDLARIKHREQPFATLQAANFLFENGMYKDSLNRTYYSCFHSMCACLCEQQIDHSSHRQVIIKFREQHYVRTGIFKKQMSDIIELLISNRSRSDYDVMFSANHLLVNECVEASGIFYTNVDEYLKVQYGSI